jgi:hypothetical protein
VLASVALLPPHDPTQAPPEHASPDAHFTPHAPQFEGSLVVSLQREVEPAPSELHTACPDGQAAAHDPPAEQTSVPVQSAVQVPAEQVCPCVQAVPHTPQLFGSVVVCVQDEPHCWYPAPQDAQSSPPSCSGATPQPLVLPELLQLATQLPATQSFPFPQAVPHVPQLDESVCVSVQNPVAPAATVPQTTCPVGHVERHAPPPQTSVPGQIDLQLPLVQTSPCAQTVPHVPQLLGSALVWVHCCPHCE